MKTIFVIIRDYSELDFFHVNFTCNIIYYRLLLFNTYKHFTDLMGTCTHHLASYLEMASDKFQPLEAL